MSADKRGLSGGSNVHRPLDGKPDAQRFKIKYLENPAAFNTKAAGFLRASTNRPGSV